MKLYQSVNAISLSPLNNALFRDAFASIKRTLQSACQSLVKLCAVFVLIAVSASQAFAGGAGTSGDPFTSLSDAHTVSSGRYYFNLGSGTFQADVDNSEGGGWVLVLQYIHQGGTNPALNILGAGSDLPILSSATLGTDESGDLTRWGHAGNAAMSQFTGDIELRWYADTSGHGRVIHFSSTVGVSYARTGTGSFAGINSSFTTLSGHTSNIPGTANNIYSNKGDYALTQFPFFEDAARHWGIRGDGADGSGVNGNRWEVDNFLGDASQNTRHQVWVRSAPLTVTNENDSGPGSLRQAILDANADPDRDYIDFDIAGSFAETITLSSALPAITDAGVTIDATTEGGTTCNNLWAGSQHTLIVNVIAPDSATDVFSVEADDVTIKGLAIQGGNRGVVVGNGRNRFTAQCNYVGFSSTGAWSSGGTANAIGIFTGTGSGHLIGGPGAADGNVISGNTDDQININQSHDTIIQGNFIGTNRDGSAKIDASAGGEGIRLDLSVDNLTVDRNLISGLGAFGFAAITGTNITFTNNYWGTNRAGTSLLTTTATDHIHFNGANANIQNITIGTAGNGNLFGGNRRAVRMTGGTNITIQGNTMGVSLDGSTALGHVGSAVALDNDPVNVLVGGTGAGEGNTIANTGIAGLFIEANDVTILGNSLYANTTEAIALQGSVTDALNRPVVEHVAADGSTTISAQVSADLPAGDYRVELFKVGTANPAQQGDARTYLGAFDITHGGTGTEYFRGTLTATTSVTAGDTVTATATEKPTPTTYASTTALADNGTAATSIKVFSTNDAGGGSLRDALDVANAQSAIDAVEFDIPGGGVQEIILSSFLEITDPGITIDGSTQPGASCGTTSDVNGVITDRTLLIEVGGTSDAFRIETTGVTIRGLAVGGQTGDDDGIDLNAGASATILCNHIGFRADGLTAWSIGNLGIETNDNGVADSVVIGDGTLAGRNVLGNTGAAVIQCTAPATQCTIQGNYINVAADGFTRASGSGNLSIWMGGNDSTIGGPGALDGNVIALSNTDAIRTTGARSNLTIERNFIGVAADGVTPLEANPAGTRDGIAINSAQQNLIIRGNVIGGVSGAGIDITNSIDTGAISGNYIGVGNDGVSDVSTNMVTGIALGAQTHTNLTIGGTGAQDGNVIGFASSNGIFMTGTSNVSVLGNFIGVGADGMTGVGTGGDGIRVQGTTTNLVLGDGTAGGRNIIAANGGDGTHIRGGSTNTSIRGNYFGLAADGLTALGNTVRGLTITTRSAEGGHTGTLIDGNVIASNGNGGLDITSGQTGVLGDTSTITITNNLIGVASDGTTPRGNTGYGIKNTNVPGTIMVGGTGGQNIIAHTIGNGVNVSSVDGATLAILGNSIHSNTDFGIDLQGMPGVTANDAGDGDTGPNDLLNYPVLNTITADGSTTVGYDFDLDTETNTEGYRVEFFANSAADASGHGEGEIYLGFVETGNYTAGSSLNFSGTFTASQAVPTGAIISATATRKTGANSYDVTSEFSQNYTAMGGLVVTNTNDSGTGSLRQAIINANASTDMDDITFNIPGVGPHTITLASALPQITDDGITIDGSTQPGAACGDLWAGTPHTLMIRIDDGASIVNGLDIGGGNVTIKGLSVTRFDYGIWADASSDGAVIQCNYAGLTPDGTAAGNGRGMRIEGANTQVGGLSTGQGNVISGNTFGLQTNGGATNVTVQANFIGTDPTGMVARANTNRAFANHIGTATINEVRRNLISGNNIGVNLNADDTWTGVGGADLVLAGNFIGTDRTGNAALPNTADGVSFTEGTVTNLVIGGLDPADRNVISGNTGHGINIGAQTGVSIFGNYIGVGADGTTELGNDINGINLVNSVSDIAIGDGTSNGRNVISNNGHRQILGSGNISSLTLAENYIGVDATGNAPLNNSQNVTANERDGIAVVFGTLTDVTISDNILGGFGAGGMDLYNVSGTNLLITGNNIGVGADGISNISGASGLSEVGLGVRHSTANSSLTGTISNNTIAHASGPAVIIDNISGMTVNNNIIRNNSVQGVRLTGTAHVALIENTIFDNSGLGIDLNGGTEDGNGVTANDAGDADSGSNDLLNYPVLNTIAADGSTTVGYDFDLNTQTNTNGYRVEFFANSAADGSGHGEGETYLGFVETGNYTAGSSLNFSGTFTASQAVATGTIISATATRKTGASSYDVTSEFSQNYTAMGGLVVTNTNGNGIGSLRQAIINANASPDMDDITFNIPGAGPHVISLGGALPIITDDGVTIDGSTQSGASCGQLTTGTPHTLMIQIDGTSAGSLATGLEVRGNSVTLRGLSVTNFVRHGTHAIGANNLTIECMYYGVEPDGVTKGPNVKSGTHNPAVRFTNSTNAILRNNLISGQDTDATDYGARYENVSGGAVEGNVIGLNAVGSAALANNSFGLSLDIGSNSIVIGGTTGATRNVISGNGGPGINVGSGSDNVSILGNYIGVGIDGFTAIGNGTEGIAVTASTGVSIGDGTVAGANLIANNATGVSVTETASRASVLVNRIFNNTNLGIDISLNGVTANDSGDGDSGPNALLNFPVINDFSAVGTTLYYDIDLDVPSAQDYRVDFYLNASADPSGYGEGETHLGFVELTHSGTPNFTGSFTGTQTVPEGAIISATTTRKTGPGSYDITSEFSLNFSSAAATELAASKAVTIFDPLSEGLYALPGNDVIHALTVTNTGNGSADTDSIVIFDAVSDEIDFYNGDIDDGGPETTAVSFTDANGTGLSFNYATDVKFSNSATKPNNMGQCTYTPSAGYDPAVTFVCINPKGAMAAGNPDPTFTVSYRARIK